VRGDGRGAAGRALDAQGGRVCARYASDATLLGVVVNDVPRRRASYGDYYGDGYVYQHGYARRGARGAGSNGSNGANGATDKESPSTVTEKA
jgi:hypothetical protein